MLSLLEHLGRYAYFALAALPGASFSRIVAFPP
jgi:hypothetical protein